MDTMRKTSELKFNPIKFHSYGINGTVGTKNQDEFFRSTLSQNICYCVRNEYKTINEIADDLGVSPVYVETEVDFLEEYGFLKEQNGKYIVNFIISEPTAELLTMQDSMYKKAADLYANELYDGLIASGLIDHTDIWCGQTDKPITLTECYRGDKNFILWALIPYITAESGEKLVQDRISFEEVATIRPDGAHNIAHASVVPDNMVLPEDYVYMRNWCGPFRYSNKKYSLGHTLFWQLDTEWSGRRMSVGKEDYERIERVLSLEKSEAENGMLSKDEYIWLSELGYIKTNGDYDGYFKSSWQIVTLASNDVKEKLLAMTYTLTVGKCMHRLRQCEVVYRIQNIGFARAIVPHEAVDAARERKALVANILEVEDGYVVEYHNAIFVSVKLRKFFGMARCVAIIVVCVCLVQCCNRC